MAIEIELFGKEEKPNTDPEAPLKWEEFKADNYFVKTLRKTAGLFAYAVKKEAEDTMKKIEQARKVFYGH